MRIERVIRERVERGSRGRGAASEAWHKESVGRAEEAGAGRAVFSSEVVDDVVDRLEDLQQRAGGNWTGRLDEMRWEQGRRQEERNSCTRKEGETWYDGGGIEGSQQWRQVMAGSRWKRTRRDLTVPQDFGRSRRVGARREEKKPVARRQVGGKTEGGPGAG